MAKSPAKPTKEAPPVNEADDEALPDESIYDYFERQAVEEELKYEEWLKADPRNPRRVKRPEKWSEFYDPNLGVN